MADCSKTEVFLAEWERMCENAPLCKDCDMQNNVVRARCTSKALCLLAVLSHKEEAIKIVQQWSDEHPAPPPKTYADDYFEKFPKAARTKCGTPFTCRENTYGTKCKVSDNEGFNGLNGDRCVECWNEPYKEGEENG